MEAQPEPLGGATGEGDPGARGARGRELAGGGGADAGPLNRVASVLKVRLRRPWALECNPYGIDRQPTPKSHSAAQGRAAHPGDASSRSLTYLLEPEKIHFPPP